MPWSAWHRRVVVGLGITWMLDGLEVTLAGAIGNLLREPDTLRAFLSSAPLPSPRALPRR